ncbi:hypothetical protein BN978_01304 [Mycolicibacterium mageritense DSM 44476 = CIP 104973]|nr:hypothetical protein BN978_01304 [Mycolicibacterium mageritense DSM 44476 = CIP 104973]
MTPGIPESARLHAVWTTVPIGGIRQPWVRPTSGATREKGRRPGSYKAQPPRGTPTLGRSPASPDTARDNCRIVPVQTLTGRSDGNSLLSLFPPSPRPEGPVLPVPSQHHRGCHTTSRAVPHLPCQLTSALNANYSSEVTHQCLYRSLEIFEGVSRAASPGCRSFGGRTSHATLGATTRNLLHRGCIGPLGRIFRSAAMMPASTRTGTRVEDDPLRLTGEGDRC